VKIITEPSVRLVAVPMFLPHPVYEIPPHFSEAEQIIAVAGKVCYDSYGVDGNPVSSHVRNLVRSGHHSVLEHAHFGLFLEGISRGCSHEIVRHRMFNYSQRSTRYTRENDAAIVLEPYLADIYRRGGFEQVAPDQWEGNGATTPDEQHLLSGFLRDCDAALRRYVVTVASLETMNPEQLSGRDLRKWCRGKARQLLPHALETRMVMTGNLRAWRHFLLMRTSRHAEPEIRRLAEAIWIVLKPLAPVVWEDLRPEVVAGFVELTATPRAA
jgi:thymidylate synthase (FAD)